MLKATVLYGHPQNPGAFEKYYAETYTPVALQILHPGYAEVIIFSP